jgi:hypothetical protein
MQSLAGAISPGFLFRGTAYMGGKIRKATLAS